MHIKNVSLLEPNTASRFKNFQLLKQFIHVYGTRGSLKKGFLSDVAYMGTLSASMDELTGDRARKFIQMSR
jgi:hypothetical protein